MVERKVGEVFQLPSGLRLMVRRCLDCKECYYKSRRIRCDWRLTGFCSSVRRSDGHSVVFVHEMDWTSDEIMSISKRITN